MAPPSLPWILPPAGSAERLTALDASFLFAETPRTPLHIGALAVFEGAPFFDEDGAFRIDAVRAQVASRLHLFPRFRKRVLMPPWGQGRPVWVDHADFDIADHVRLMVLPEPGSEAELSALTATLHMRLLDRSRPLWELWFIGGLADGNVAMVEKVHHAMIDGVSGVDVAAALLDLEPEPPAAPAPAWIPVPPPHPVPLVLSAWWELVGEPAAAVRGLGGIVTAPIDAVRRVQGIVDAIGTELGALTTHAPFRQTVGMRRRLEWLSVPLEDVRHAGHQVGATVNDVVLAAVAGGFRDLLDRRGAPVDAEELQCLVPVDVRSQTERGALGNKVAAIVAPLPVHEPSPLVRVGLVRDAMAGHKAHHEPDGTALLVEGVGLLPATALALFSRLVHHQPVVDVVVTNIPGPACPLYFLGARMVSSVPVVPLGGNLPVGVAVLSYDGALTLGFHADPDAVPDLDVLVRGVARDFAELIAALAAP